jgi:hypothetical protein
LCCAIKGVYARPSMKETQKSNAVERILCRFIMCRKLAQSYCEKHIFKAPFCRGKFPC